MDPTVSVRRRLGKSHAKNLAGILPGHRLGLAQRSYWFYGAPVRI